MLVMHQNTGQYGSNESETKFPVKEKHNDENSKTCNQCDLAFSLKSSLKEHLKTHNKERSNKCNQCDYASSRADSLRKHVKTHSGEKSNK